MPADRRTLWLAGGAWVGAALGWIVPGSGVPIPLAAASLTAGTAALAAGWRPVAPVALIGLAAALCAVLGSDVRQPPPGITARVCDVTATVAGTARQIDTAVGEEPSVTVPLSVRSLRTGGVEWAVDLPARGRVAVADLPGALRPGQVLSFRGRLGARELLRSEVPVEIQGDLRVDEEPGGVFTLGDLMRENLGAALLRAPGGGGDAGALVAGVALGDETHQRPELAWWMQQSGLAHLTAVSGGNFVIAIGAAVFLVRVVGLGLRTQTVVGTTALLAYALVVGPQPSVLRAAVMAAIGLFGVALGGPARGLPILGTAVTGLLLVSPELAWSTGFMLSVAATASLQLLARPLATRLRALPTALRLPLAVAVAAQLATAPILVASGGTVSWVAVPANIAAAPLVAPVTVLGILAASLGPLGGVVPAAPALVGAEVIVRLAAAATWLLHTPWASLAVQATLGLLLGFALLGRVAMRWRPLLGAALGVVAVWNVGRASVAQDWRLIACDVGQGTAVLINAAPGILLVDTGPQDGDVSDCLARAGVAGPDSVILSHHHIDHVGGLPRLLSAHRPDAILGPAGAPTSPTERGVAALAAASGGLHEVAAGDRFAVGSTTVTVLWPARGRRVPEDDVNNGSAVLLVEWVDGVRALLPGDVEPESQRRIMAGWQLPPVDVLLMPHHGSDHQDPRFASWVGSTVAIASAGQGNSYGHPAAQTLAEYEAAGASVWRTDLAGTVTVSVVDGGVVEVGEG